jgi:hypothetical protein
VSPLGHNDIVNLQPSRPSQPIDAKGQRCHTEHNEFASRVQTQGSSVRTTAPGGRNHAVNRAAFKLARLVVVGELGEAEVTVALAEAAATAGLGRVEAAHAIASGLAARQDPTRHHAFARRQGRGAR